MAPSVPPGIPTGAASAPKTFNSTGGQPKNGTPQTAKTKPPPTQPKGRAKALKGA